MEEIIQFLAGILNREFIRAVFSNPRVKDNVVKAKLRPTEQKGELLFQLESFTKTQAFHKNLTVEETKDELAKLLEEFRQVQVETVSEDITVLISKKGKATIKRKRKKVQAKAADLSHNRKKKYILEEGIAVPFLTRKAFGTARPLIIILRLNLLYLYLLHYQPEFEQYFHLA